MQKVLLGSLLAFGLTAGSAGAAAVSTAGSSIDTGGDLTSAGLGQTVTGSLHWDFSAGPQVSQDIPALTNNQRNNLPAGVTFGPGADNTGVAGGWGYQQVTDDFGGPFESGALTSGGANPAELATLTIGAGGPTELRLGLYVDHTDGSGGHQFLSTDYNVSVGASNATANPAPGNLNGDVLWFDITGLINGDVISIIGAGATQENLLGGIITAEIPEPGSLALLGLGGLAVLRRRR